MEEGVGILGVFNNSKKFKGDLPDEDRLYRDRVHYIVEDESDDDTNSSSSSGALSNLKKVLIKTGFFVFLALCVLCIVSQEYIDGELNKHRSTRESSFADKLFNATPVDKFLVMADINQLERIAELFSLDLHSAERLYPDDYRELIQLLLYNNSGVFKHIKFSSQEISRSIFYKVYMILSEEEQELYIEQHPDGFSLQQDYLPIREEIENIENTGERELLLQAYEQRQLDMENNKLTFTNVLYTDDSILMTAQNKFNDFTFIFVLDKNGRINDVLVMSSISTMDSKTSMKNTKLTDAELKDIINIDKD